MLDGLEGVQNNGSVYGIESVGGDSSTIHSSSFVLPIDMEGHGRGYGRM